MAYKLIAAAVVAFALLQMVRPEIPVKPATAEVQVPPEIRHVLEKSCYSCHSDQLRLAWFDQIVPAYWLVRHDILTARQHLNFSTLGLRPAAAQQAALYEAVNMIKLGAMPLASFRKLHPEAEVTPNELAAFEAYLAPWTRAPNPPVTAVGNDGADGVPVSPSLTTAQPEFNGFPFQPTFETWKLISTTDRGDNNTFRFILGNEIAVQAARSGNISPWPDGSCFAKIAWQQQAASDGLIHPGNFVHVEFMLKNAKRYKRTDGWGWGRWRGLDLKPYGKDARFVNECTGCHRPVRNNDYVYTLPITTARVSGNDVVNNGAVLPSNLPYQPLDWRAITMYVDPKAHTVATLFGNDTAVHALPRHADSAVTPVSPAYPAGAVLALVTWAQREDPHWFGARIPAAPLSVEFVQVPDAKQAAVYRRFAGAGMVEDHTAATIAGERVGFVEGLAPARLP